jgi:galactokinase
MEKILQIYSEKFTKTASLFRSPGRVNLIGEHTDYNEGFVLPGTINKSIFLLIAKNDKHESHLYAADLQEEHIFNSEDFTKADKTWPNYFLGILDQLKKQRISIPNFDVAFGGNIPIGAGLSSSAAIESGFLFALDNIFDLGLDKYHIARLSQKAENEYVGINCGIMDMFINLFGKENHFLKLDCRSLEYKYYPFNFENVEILLCNTGVSHFLADSAYNERRRQCEEGVEILKYKGNDVCSLRDVSQKMLSDNMAYLSDTVFNRCNYIIKENQRVHEIGKALSENDLEKVGNLMYESHNGLKNDYEVSCVELDFLVEAARKLEGVYGARMMGGGFGGCTINLIDADKKENIKNKLKELYEAKFQIKLETFTTKIETGTEEITENISLLI